MGKSATGKDTIYKRLLESKELNLKKVIGYTTRPIRAGEKNGSEYFFINQEELEGLRKDGKIIEIREYHTVHGLWNYFTVNDSQINLNKDNYLMIGTLESYEQIRNYYGEEFVYPIYIEVEDGIRLTRALEREKKQDNPKYAELCRRYLADEEDFKEENLIRLGIKTKYQNQEINQCVSTIIYTVGGLI